ncbi:MAG: 1,4-dihydroxy-2-naphthoate polyprenyltransferase [Actinobacteria bacterium]|nr:1,4-dihydroxy-2-naphthoate polyprenyltransferase [Actinomycetota bacterium]
MTTREQWIAGARPKTLPAVISPVIVGTAFAGYNANAPNFFLALIVGLGLQIGVNYANDYSDGIRGTDSERIGQMRLVGSGAATADAVKRAALISIGVAALAGTLLAARTSLALIAIGAISIVAAWTYTGGPKPYGYFALGEVSVFIFFGLVATLGTYFVHTESISLEVSLAAIAMGFLSCSILVLNNLRDIDKDKVAGKKTLAVKIGDSATRRFLQALLISPLFIALLLLPNSFYNLIVILAIPQVIFVVKRVRAGALGSDLIELLERTGRIQIIYALAISFAALLSAR